MSENDNREWGVRQAIKLYFHPLMKIHRKGIIFAWLLTLLWIGMQFYTFHQKLDRICDAVECVE